MAENLARTTCEPKHLQFYSILRFEGRDSSPRYLLSLLVATLHFSSRFQMERVLEMRSGLMLRVILSILILAGFLVGSLIYVGFYTESFSTLQKIISILVAMIIAFAILAIVWVTWAGRRGMMGWWRD